MSHWLVAFFAFSLTFTAQAATPIRGLNLTNTVDVKITILSDMLPSRRTRSEWGFCAFVEIDSGGKKKYILFDTGDKDDTVIFNSKVAKDKDLPRVNFSTFKNNEIEVVLSHFHSDHTTGLWRLLEEYPQAFGKVHIGEHALEPRYRCKRFDKATGDDRKCLDIDITKQMNTFLDASNKFIAKYGQGAFNQKFVTHRDFSPVWQDTAAVWVTGAIPRVTNEDNAGSPYIISRGSDHTYDNVPDEISLVINTPKGLLVLTGCAHAGIINTLNHVSSTTGITQVDTLIGGMHLLTLKDSELNWTANQLRRFNIKTLLGSHCTGTERLIALRAQLNMTAKSAPFSTVETVFDSVSGISLPSPAINSPLTP